jgi:hypothetical protein
MRMKERFETSGPARRRNHAKNLAIVTVEELEIS